ncbi:MAG: 16S rRNA processing protein RimM [Planctomycetes bacterium]|nr:16S rRNA processing protein RimM [Planctomycetota bacterium]
MQDADLIEIGRILRPFGTEGEVLIRLWSGQPAAIEGRTEIQVRDATGNVRTLAIDQILTRGRRVYLHFPDMDTPEAVARLRGLTLLVPPEDARTLEPDEYFLFQLEGLTVLDTAGNKLGEVVSVMDNPGNDLLVIRHNGAEHLVPLVKTFVRQIDLERRTLELQTIDGLLDME